MDTFNYRVVNKIISKSPAYVRRVNKFFQDQFEESKDEMLAEFEDHPVTQEIEGGPDAENISHTLDGHGNLYSFIGFPAGENPTEIVKEILRTQTKMIISEKAIENNKISYRLSIRIPRQELEDATPFEWLSGRSWLYDIEKGISGLPRFLAGDDFPTSRSGGGIEVKNEVRHVSYRPVPYINSILRDWARNLKNSE